MRPLRPPLRSLLLLQSPLRVLSILHPQIPFLPNGLPHRPRLRPQKPRPSFITKPPSSRPYSAKSTLNLAYSSTGKLAGKRAIITGASRGIGAAIARRFAAEGARCVLVGRDEGRLDIVREGLAKVGGEDGEEDGRGRGGHVVRIGDVGDGEFWRGLRREKPIDILVNAAGVTHYSPLFVTTEDLLEKVVKTNLMGTMLGCKAIGRAMMGNVQGGCIINVASLLALKGGKGSAGYAASKAGVIGFTRALAAEVGKSNIRINVVVPGYIETDMTAAMTPEARSEALDAIPLKRFGEASEIADAVVFLATNKYASNCVLNLDGGLSAI